MTQHIPYYPLAWPDGWKRAKGRRSSVFRVHTEKAVNELEYEVQRLGGKNPILSSNVQRTMSGTLRLTDAGSPLLDPGVAIYFTKDGVQKVIACDTFYTPRENIRALTKTIEALRSIERNGASALLERTLSAFDALPPPSAHWSILGIPRGSNRATVEQAFRAKAAQAHPDVGGSNEAMSNLNDARAAALKEIGP